jgi:hypothetical protein
MPGPQCCHCTPSLTVSMAHIPTRALVTPASCLFFTTAVDLILWVQRGSQWTCKLRVAGWVESTRPAWRRSAPPRTEGSCMEITKYSLLHRFEVPEGMVRSFPCSLALLNSEMVHSTRWVKESRSDSQPPSPPALSSHIFITQSPPETSLLLLRIVCHDPCRHGAAGHLVLNRAPRPPTFSAVCSNTKQGPTLCWYGYVSYHINFLNCRCHCRCHPHLQRFFYYYHWRLHLLVQQRESDLYQRNGPSSW